MEGKMRASEHSERLPEIPFLIILLNSILNMGATPLWGGAREPKEDASGWLSEAKDQTLASSFGEGGAGGRSASVRYAA